MRQPETPEADLLAHFGGVGIMPDDLILGMGRLGCRVVWPAGEWPALETQLAAAGFLEPFGDWATCYVRFTVAVLPAWEQNAFSSYVITCIPLGSRRDELADDRILVRRAERLAFAVRASFSGHTHPFNFFRERNRRPRLRRTSS